MSTTSPNTHWSTPASGCAANPASSTACKRSLGPHAAESKSTLATPARRLTAADRTPLTRSNACSTAEEHEEHVMPATRNWMLSGPLQVSAAPRAAASKPQSSTALTSVSCGGGGGGCLLRAGGGAQHVVVSKGQQGSTGDAHHQRRRTTWQTAGSKVMAALCIGSDTVALETPRTLLSAVSTALVHAAQCMPCTASSTTCDWP